MTASYTSFAPGNFLVGGQPNSNYDYFAEWATFTDIVTTNASTAGNFNFTISGSSIASHIVYADWVVGVSLAPCSNGVCASPGLVTAGALTNGKFSLYAISNSGPGQYELEIQLQTRVALFDPNNPLQARGTNLSGTSDYNDTLTLDSVTLAPGETMIGQRRINYGDLGATSVPEPGSIALFFTAFAGLAQVEGTVAN
jgi:hypothetical protein